MSIIEKKKQHNTLSLTIFKISLLYSRTVFIHIEASFENLASAKNNYLNKFQTGKLRQISSI